MLSELQRLAQQQLARLEERRAEHRHLSQPARQGVEQQAGACISQSGSQSGGRQPAPEVGGWGQGRRRGPACYLDVLRERELLPDPAHRQRRGRMAVAAIPLHHGHPTTATTPYHPPAPHAQASKQASKHQPHIDQPPSLPTPAAACPSLPYLLLPVLAVPSGKPRTSRRPLHPPPPHRNLGRCCPPPRLLPPPPVSSPASC